MVDHEFPLCNCNFRIYIPLFQTHCHLEDPEGQLGQTLHDDHGREANDQHPHHLRSFLPVVCFMILKGMQLG